jgi:hypothetical protein
LSGELVFGQEGNSVASEKCTIEGEGAAKHSK